MLNINYDAGARDREREGTPRPKPAPMPTAQQQMLREKGGKVAGPRLMLTGQALTDHRRLRSSSRIWFGIFMVIYQPGSKWTKSAVTIGRYVGLEPRTVERAIRELKQLGYVARFKGGWISPMIEMKLEPEYRVWRDKQMAFEFIPDPETTLPRIAKYFGLRVVDNTKSTRPQCRVHPIRDPSETSKRPGRPGRTQPPAKGRLPGGA